ncbi:MAG: hypothetical protein V1875_04225 [Candidatus Altiarchaeota archaeon]
MSRAKIMDHPIAHGDVENEDRIIFLVVGIVVTVIVFIVMKVLEI